MAGQTIAFAAVSLFVLYGVQKLLEYRRLVVQCGGLPYQVMLFNPNSSVAMVVKTLRRVSSDALSNGYTPFEKHGCEAYATICLFPSGSIILNVADAGMIKEITAQRTAFPKPLDMYKGFAFFGDNILAAEGDEWKKFKRISAPAFSERNNKMVWDETYEIVRGLLDDVWGNAPEVAVPHALSITLPIALFVIGVAGFGQRISWGDDDRIPPGHNLKFKDALEICARDMIFRILFSDKVLGIWERGRRVRTAFNDLDNYMLEMIRARRDSEKKSERYDLFSGLLDAADEEPGGRGQITDRELMGNIFIFLLAGHETTAHTLCFSLAYLALYPEEQDKLYAEIRSALEGSSSSNAPPGYESMSKVPFALAVLHETLRLQPAVVGIPKTVAEDTTLAIRNFAGHTHTYPVTAGTLVNISAAGMQRNPRLWPDPLTFRPSRFLSSELAKDKSQRDAFIAFSDGPRRCIGQRFAETEAAATLCCLLGRYSVHLTYDEDVPGETREERRVRREKILDNMAGITITPKKVPLTFRRRI